MGEVDDFMWKGGMVLVILREGRAEPCPYGVGDAKGKVEKGKRKEKQAVSAIIRESSAFWERPKRTGVKRRVKA